MQSQFALRALPIFSRLRGLACDWLGGLENGREDLLNGCDIGAELHPLVHIVLGHFRLAEVLATKLGQFKEPNLATKVNQVFRQVLRLGKDL